MGILLKEILGKMNSENFLEDSIAKDTGLPSYSPEKLQAMSNQELFDLLSTLDDRVPREVIDACGTRGEAMLPLLEGYLADEANWSEMASTAQWWGLLHCVFALGAMETPQAAKPLLDALLRMSEDEDNPAWEWFSGYWPALFRGKLAAALPELERLALDRTKTWFTRVHALGCITAAAQEQGAEALEQNLDWVATLAADPSDDNTFRTHAGLLLLSFPRPRHQNLLEELIRTRVVDSDFPAFDLRDIRKSLREGDHPEWERFDDPLSFYKPEEILRRQARWEEEALEEKMKDEDLPLQKDFLSSTTYIRATPKVGRNDPCPCGSGKKYKKCCLGKEMQ